MCYRVLLNLTFAENGNHFDSVYILCTCLTRAWAHNLKVRIRDGKYDFTESTDYITVYFNEVLTITMYRGRREA